MLLKCGDLELPVSYITSFSYSRSANLVDVSGLTKRFRGLEPVEVAVSFVLRNDYFDYNNLLSRLLLYKVEKVEPSPIMVGGLRICPDLLFNLESLSTTPISDIYGTIFSLECNFVFSSTRVNNNNSSEASEVHDEGVVVPDVSWFCKGKELKIGSNSSISSFMVSPDRLYLEFHFGDTFIEISSRDFILTPSTSGDSYIEVDGFGKFYVQSVSRKESNYIGVEATRMGLDFYKTQHICEYSTTLSKVLGLFYSGIKLKGGVENVFDVPIEYINLTMTAEEFVGLVCENLGFIPLYGEDSLTLCAPPDKLSSINEVEYEVDVETAGLRTEGVILESGYEIYRFGDIDSPTVRTIKLPFSISKNVSATLLKYIQLRERQVEVIDFPYDSRIKHGSVITLVIDGEKVPYFVFDYTFNILSNTMTLVCNTV